MAEQSKRSKSSTSRRRLGRGLGSLITAPVRVDPPVADPAPRMPAKKDSPVLPETPARTGGAEESPVGPEKTAKSGPEVLMLARTDLRPNPHQPRQRFDPEALRKLADSILTAGLMQPLVVRPVPASDGGGGYELIAGERRWRAAEIAGLDHIPAIVQHVDDRTSAEWSLIENLQREDLNPIERGEAFHRLAEEFGLGHQEIALRVGLDRSSVTNHLRLLGLDELCRETIASGQLTAGHGKALLAIANIQDRQSLAAQAMKRQWSVRELERRVRDRQKATSESPAGPPAAASPNPHMADLQRRLGEHLGTRVRIAPGRKKGAGKLIIEFYDLDQFEGLMQQLRFEHD